LTRYRLTTIEKLDQRFPGLADQVRTWFAQGIPAREIAELLGAQYGARASEDAVEYFRSRRWVPEQELLREKKIAALAAQEVSREQAIRASEVPGGVE
jgi:hypothetical protein